MLFHAVRRMPRNRRRQYPSRDSVDHSSTPLTPWWWWCGGGGGGLNIPEMTRNNQLVCGKIVNNNDNFVVGNSKFSDSTNIIKQDHSNVFSLVRDIQGGVQDHTPEFVTNDYYQCGPGFESYPQASEYKVIVGNDNSFPFNGKLSTGMLEHNLEVGLQPVIEVSNTENAIQCVAPEALTCDSHQCCPGFEYYPQVSQCKLSAGSDKNFLINDKLSTRTLKSDLEMDLQPLIKGFDAEYFHSHTAVSVI